MIKSTDEIIIPTSILDQVIGQSEAIDVLKKAVNQRRNLLMIGPPGIGKSMLAKAYAEMLGKRETFDTLAYYNEENPYHPIIRHVKNGETLIESFIKETQNPINYIVQNIVEICIFLFLIIYQLFTRFDASLTLLGLLIVIIYNTSKKSFSTTPINNIPEIIINGSKDAQFIDATGLASSGLFGDVLHDPYQSGGLQTPAHKRLIPGAVHRANQGVLYMDEVGTLSPKTQIELLTVLQEREVPIIGRSRESVSSSVNTKPIPADFGLVLSGNMETIEMIHPALRSRIQGFGYEIILKTEMNDTEENRLKIARFIAQEVDKDGSIPHFNEEGITKIIEISKIMARKKNSLTLELRKLGGIVRRAGDIANQKNLSLVTDKEVSQAKLISSNLEGSSEVLNLPSAGTIYPSNNYMDLRYGNIKFFPDDSKDRIYIVGLNHQVEQLINAEFKTLPPGTIYCNGSTEISESLIKAPLIWEILHSNKNKLNIIIGELINGELVEGDHTLRQVDNVLTTFEKTNHSINEIVIICPVKFEKMLRNYGFTVKTGVNLVET